ncbi:respiratory nitrate reductase subunit gamma [Allorhizocola rhizosphaerae]|uniref:respiratory nitrate reductase subunit gamma n=1 Tax=Allorhizocola rhizosphaerae TaxID=1872709 RepID=UPI000E3D05F4|nr:respiratory nitrate reductase subunit gamma [Allorhizocola rhizosphaerae]
MRLAVWGVLPYLALASFVIGLAWRYRYDKAGWTARSSQLHERRLLALGSPLFHYGILLTAGGHAMGLLIPAGWTRAVGLSDGLYRVVAFGVGGMAGVMTVTGLAILVYRRLTVRAVGRASLASDLVMYVLLGTTILMGLAITLTGNGHDYRATVAPWFRSIFVLQPSVDAIAQAPFGFQLHALVAWALIAAWPYTRLVHAFSLPLGYLTRPYIVYRSREASRARAMD